MKKKNYIMIIKKMTKKEYALKYVEMICFMISAYFLVSVSNCLFEALALNRMINHEIPVSMLEKIKILQVKYFDLGLNNSIFSLLSAVTGTTLGLSRITNKNNSTPDNQKLMLNK